MEAQKKNVVIWLAVVSILVYATVIIGGITRLTESGLSMVDWRPIAGILPPLTVDQWEAVFSQYKNTPQFVHVFPNITLSEFKGIFFWEYIHRVLGRLIGIAYGIPLLIFWWKGYFTGKGNFRFVLGLVLGGLQGVLGWYMVRSGLVDLPRVSHLRLAAHLSLALFILGYLWWHLCSLVMKKKPAGAIAAGGSLLSLLIPSLFFILSLQIVYGSLLAGLRGGAMYNTFPDMNGMFVPPGLFYLPGFFENFISNPLLVQFIHRILGWLLLLLTVALVWSVVKQSSLDRGTRRMAFSLAALIAIQFVFGVITLLTRVDFIAASVHQALGVLCLITNLTLVFLWFRRPMTSRPLLRAVKSP